MQWSKSGLSWNLRVLAVMLAALILAGFISMPVEATIDTGDVAGNGPGNAPVATDSNQDGTNAQRAGTRGDNAASTATDQGTTATSDANVNSDPNDPGSQPSDTTPASAPSSPPQPPKRVGIQAGHWKIAELPSELASLRGQTGTAGGGVTEMQLNLDIANRVAAILETQGIIVDVLPATVPPGYQADAFVALHADGNSSSKRTGFKLARASWSAIPQTDDALLASISSAYASATMLPVDPDVTLDMTEYYAFNNRAFQHAIAPSTPGVILEMGFMTNASDRAVMLRSPETVAVGIAQGILHFLGIGIGNAQ